MKYFFVALIFCSVSAMACNKAVTYAPSKTELEGIIDLQTFPGPPNYESIEHGDATERGFYLKLDHPIDVLPEKGNAVSDVSEREKNVKIIQLAVGADDDKLWTLLRKLDKKSHVQVKGTLFHRFTGHHHSRVLISVEDIQVKY